MGYSFRLTARDILYAPSHTQDSTYHGLCYTVVEHWLERDANLEMAIANIGLNQKLTLWKRMFYLTIHSTYFIYGYMASNIW